MRGLIVDCWRPCGRVAKLIAALDGVEVYELSQLSEEAEEEWDAVADEVRELLAEYNFILLHVGEHQKFRLELLQDICPSRPVFCYTGGPESPAIKAHCQTPGLHVLSPGSFSRDDAGALPNVVLRWLEVLGPAPSQGTAIAAWQEVNRIDPDKQKTIEALDAKLVELLRQHSWTPERAISGDLSAALKRWRDDLGVR